MRRAGVVAVHSLDHVAFDVPDLDEARRFYTAFGLVVELDGDRGFVCTHGDPRPWLVLGRSTTGRKQLRHLSFGAYADDLPALTAQLAARCPGAGPMFQGPHGIAVEVRAAPKRTLDAPAAPVAPARGVRAAPLRSAKPAVVPTRLSHTLLFSPDLAASIAFYAGALGLRLSDDAGAVAFLHAPHGCDHHLLAFAHGPHAGLHHVSWCVPTFDDVGLGAMQMADAGFTRGWGVGRHVLGSNYFHYVRDPWGSYSEYSYDIDYVPADIDWQASSQTPDNGFYLWGPSVPDDFTVNYEAAL
jgi:catechol 2,3-dioxygenase-like lactoylglutathione lyase family enzyme